MRGWPALFQVGGIDRKDPDRDQRRDRQGALRQVLPRGRASEENGPPCQCLSILDPARTGATGRSSSSAQGIQAITGVQADGGTRTKNARPAQRNRPPAWSEWPVVGQQYGGVWV